MKKGLFHSCCFYFRTYCIDHTANNKQKQIPRGRRLIVENLLGQINSIKKIVEKKLASSNVI